MSNKKNCDQNRNIDKSIDLENDPIQDNASKPIAHQALEKRLLLDAAFYSTLADSAPDDGVNESIDAAIAQISEQVLDEPAVSPPTDERDVLILDESIPNIQALIDELQGAGDLYFISPESDGVEQLQEILSGLSDVSAMFHSAGCVVV